MRMRLWDFNIALVGSMLMGLGVALTIRANFGLDALTLFNSGISNYSGMPIGTVSQIVMLTLLIVLWFVERRRVGWGTLINGLSVGFFINLFISLIPSRDYSVVARVFSMLIGLVLLGIGIGTYISANLGESGIDALMILFTDRLNKKINRVRIIIDLILAIIGILLRGQYGLGTCIALLINGPIISITISVIQKIKMSKMITE